MVVEFTWAGKGEWTLKVQEATAKKLVPYPEESVNFNTSNNLFLEGDNLDALKLLQDEYAGKIKCIYIDPPYNTGKKFVYHDKLSHDEWLNMMYPRLYLARTLLRDDGVIFISIDDNEHHHLRMICDEIFGEKNFIANVIWQKKYAPQNDAKWFSPDHDHIVVYAKSKEIWRPIQLPRTTKANSLYKNPDNDPRGVWKPSNMSVQRGVVEKIYPITTPSGRIVYPPPGRPWAVSKQKLQELMADNRIWFGKDGASVPSIKRFLSEVKNGITPLTIWTHQEVGHTQDATREILGLFNYPYFDTPKPVKLIQRILQISTSTTNQDIVIDLFAGSCTTAHAVMRLNAEDGGNRKFIMVQLDEKYDEKSEAFKAGYKTIAGLGKERMRRAAAKIKDEYGLFAPKDLGFKVLKIEL